METPPGMACGRYARPVNARMWPFTSTTRSLCQLQMTVIPVPGFGRRRRGIEIASERLPKIRHERSVPGDREHDAVHPEYSRTRVPEDN